MFNLKGRVAVVTGASSGLGKQMARGFAEAGANLVILARRMDRLEELKKELEPLGVRVFPIMCDVTSTEDINNAAAMAEEVLKLTAICTCCGNLATKTQRIINGKPAYYDDPIILVGEKESYEARCRNCHIVLKRNEN